MSKESGSNRRAWSAEIEKSAPAGCKKIDLSGHTVLPGLADCHTHVLLQGDITQADYDEQLLKESIPYRTIRATVAAKTALMNGFTAIRDLETEGAMYADVDVKRAIERGIIPGPRMFVSTRAFSATGMYPLLGYSWELKVPEGVQVVDGPDEIRKAVREQVKYGADWIKFYCDRRYYLEGGKLRSKVNFTEEEMRAIVGEAHRLDRRVAAHAIGKDGIMAALKAGVDTIEHGDGLDEESIDLMVKKGVYWCPTIYVTVYVAEGRAAAGNPIWKTMVDLERKAFGLAVKKGAKIAYGTDAGGYSWTENQAKEFSYMVRYGMTPMQAIQSATVVAAELLDDPRTWVRSSRQVRRHRGRRWRPAQGHRRARAGDVRHEGREGCEGARGGAIASEPWADLKVPTALEVCTMIDRVDVSECDRA